MSTMTMSSASRALRFGSKRANLVTIRDSGKEKVEFRVQCEVLISESAAQRIEELVMGRGTGDRPTEGEMNELTDLVTKLTAEGASEEFKQIIAIAFKDQLNPLPDPDPSVPE